MASVDALAAQLSSFQLNTQEKMHRRRGSKWRIKKRALQQAPIYLGGRPAEGQTCLLAPRAQWQSLPDWIALDKERRDGRFPPLATDPLFRDIAFPCVLPFFPHKHSGAGAVVICPGGNYEFLSPCEGAPVARWVTESLGVPAFVLRYRLLPGFGLAEALHDLERSIREARRHACGGPVAD